ncbi:DoxX family protein [Allosphingosinicella flava]|uniref:DoxX family protein n=1 Tax=Allosphingosinicella flava TaxID=2771430 RepID=A0A7T2LLN6_9SPHN|nr:DoxX family protein [Sphingosinicella flava]QPQ54563.1 DoxX family protein [Sphingosinicella flava]
MNANLTAWQPRVLSLLRIVSALLFLEHGTWKLLGFPAGGPDAVPLLSMMGIAGILEIVLGLLLLAGLFTRLAAFIASGQMAVAYWMAHAPKDAFPINNGGDAAILFCFIFLYIVFSGPGAWSLDARRASRRT